MFTGNSIMPSTSSEPIYFLRKKGEEYSIFSQWYNCKFTAPAPNANDPPMTFGTCEQYMMYHKAMLFGDKETADKIMETEEPKQQKAFGRKVVGFNEQVWNENRERIVEGGNWNKFTNATEEWGLAKKLVETEDRLIVEAAPYDRIWGIGYSKEDAEANKPDWGLNLLGKALMAVRKRLREQLDSQNHTTCEIRAKL